MNPDRATLNFLNTFPDESKTKGEEIQKAGCVTQIFGNHLFIRGRVELDHGPVLQTSLRLDGNRWLGTSDSPEGDECPALYATMLERLERGENLPEAPNEVGEKSVYEILESAHGRELSEAEEFFLGKLEKRYRRYAIEQKIFDHDLVRISPKWEVSGYDALTLWPVPPADILEFWNYIAYAFEKKGIKYRETALMEPITDIAATRAKMAAWENEQEVGDWQERVELLLDQPEAPSSISGAFRMMVTTNEARLQWRAEGEEEVFTGLEKVELAQLVEQHEKGGIELDAASELLWVYYLAHRQQRGMDEVRLDSETNCRFLNHLFQQPALAPLMVNLDEQPLVRIDAPLRWVCKDEPADDGDDETPPQIGPSIELTMADDEPVPYGLRVLPGATNLYLTDEAVFEGPPPWTEGTAVDPRYEVPRSVLETVAGVEFLGRIDADLPESLVGRVQDEKMGVQIQLELSKKITAAESEHMLMRVVAKDEGGFREETLVKEGWKITGEKEPEKGRLLRFDRSLLNRIPPLLDPLNVSFDTNVNAFKTRVVKQFPQRFTDWVETLPPEVELVPDGELETLLRDPVKAQLKFEVVDQDIDWFDLKIIVKVEGYDLSPEEIKQLVSARGEFVRMKKGGWLRIEFDLGEEQREAVSRLGLDPYDLSGDTHRMHALQLSDPKAKEVFDEGAWDKICDRAEAVQLQVRPAVPDTIDAELRPYQVEGFHYLAYLAANRFGGILADDMGLGKTLQSLTWIMWLREQSKDPGTVLVVCPKSVLDVWAAEMHKFAPSVNVQVLRSKEELDMEQVRDHVDVLVVNYSQLRVCADALNTENWLAVILDEGQQIKNPDSKAAKAARSLTSENRLVLTGTPIENRLLDIWSLMSFAMPGVLGGRKYFRDRFDRRKDPQSQLRLSARMRPFLLRRTKGQVAMDLPPRTEENVLCKMEGVQAKLYQEEMERIQKVLLGLETDEALRKNSFVVLQGLMRLRQICCHPALVDQKYIEEESAKMNALFYLLDQLREEGHKVLVFSQFVTMLDIIKVRLATEERKYNYLTGQTKDRQKEIEDFQTTKDPSVFLLSLKAGGSGLNLTAASYVILYDPWWNPAVENQAIDRTHRIGQTSKVIAYRLIMGDSVEEKIRTLQEQKEVLAGGVLGEESFARNLELKDIQFLFQPDEPDEIEAETVEIEA